MAKVPFPYISGSIDDRSRFELERNFQYLTDQLTGTTVTGWDAIVDPTVAADNTSTKVFKTVFAAIKYLADTAGITNMTIGMRNTSTIASEIGTYGGTTSGLTVRVIAIGDMPPGFFNGSVSPAVPVWDLAGFDTNSKFQRLFLAGIRIAKKESAVVPNATFLTVGSIGAMNCYFDGQGASSTTVTSNLSGGTFIGCQFTDVSFTSDTMMLSCLVQYNRLTGTVVNGGQMVWLDTMLSGVSNSFTFQCQTTGTIIVDGPSQITNVSAPVMTWQITAAKDIHIRQTVTIGIGREHILTITSPNILQCVIEGVFDELTVPAPKAATAAVAHRIAATTKNRADITGPANITLSVHDGSALSTYALRLRGSGINGNVSVWLADSAAVATALDFIGALRCSINASITRVGAASTGHKQYAFDAASANNILILEADALGTASTDAGASDLVITDATFGSSPTTTTILADFSQAFMMGTL